VAGVIRATNMGHIGASRANRQHRAKESLKMCTGACFFAS
jgi:hypothetical protein